MSLPIRIDELTQASVVSAGAFVPIVVSGFTRRATLDDIHQVINSDEITLTQDSDTDYLIKIIPSNSAVGNFNQTMFNAVSEAVTNTVWRIGYNAAPGGGREDATEPAWFFSIEADFKTGGVEYMEFHAEGVHTDGTSFRNWSWLVNRSTKAITHQINAETVNIFDGTGVNQAYQFTISTITGSFLCLTGSTIKHDVNNEGFIQQKNVAGSSYVNLINLNSGDQVAIAPSGGGVLVNQALTLEEKRMFISQAKSGADVSTMMFNSSNTANSTAFFQALVAGATASDAFYIANINGGVAWAWGLDNSDSDAFVISEDAVLGSNNRIKIAVGGVVTIPSLAGTGSRTVVANANGVLSAP